MSGIQQPEALRLAEMYDFGDPAAHGNAWKSAVCTELHHQHARIEELEKYESNLIDQRDHCEEIIDRMADAVLGEDRPEWSSAYDFMDAAQDVDDRIAELEAQLDAIGAGGVEALRKRECLQQSATVTPEKIRDVFLAHGFTIKPGMDDLKPYVYEAALALLALQTAPPAPAAVAVPDSHTQALKAIAEWPVTDMLLNMDAANMRGIAQRALSATQPAPAIFGDEDHVLVPRGLIGAACYAIDKKRDGTKTLAELRRYTTGDLSAATQPAAQGMEAEIQQAVEAERERICAAIKAEDDHCVDQGDYMLDSNDCIKIVRGKWVRPDYSVEAAQAKHGEQANG